MDFLSFLTLQQNQSAPLNYTILNSIAFFEKARPFMEQHQGIRLYLDRDTTGQNCSSYALSLSSRYWDQSKLYQHHKDLNEWLMNTQKAVRRKISTKLY